MSKHELTISRAEIFTSGIKQILIANGGGVVSLLAFLQAIWEKDKSMALVTVGGIGWMILGICACLLVAPIRVRHQHRAHRIESANPDADSRTWLWWAYQILQYLGIVFFVTGSAYVVIGALRLLA